MVSKFYFYGLLTLLVNTKKSANNRIYSTRSFYTGLLEVRHSLSFLLLTLAYTNCIKCAVLCCQPVGKDLSDSQMLLLSKGLHFIPTARDSSHFELLKKFCKRIWSLPHVSTNILLGKKFHFKNYEIHIYADSPFNLKT